jgi:ATP-dependent DNA helicase RecG
MRVQYREDKLVETTAGDAFIRSGDTKRKLTDDEKREIRITKARYGTSLNRLNFAGR